MYFSCILLWLLTPRGYIKSLLGKSVGTRWPSDLLDPLQVLNRCSRGPQSEVGYLSLPYTRSSSLVRTSGESWDKESIGCGRRFSHLRLALGSWWGSPPVPCRKAFLEQWLAWLGTEQCTCAVLGDGDEVHWVEMIPVDCSGSGRVGSPAWLISHSCFSAESGTSHGRTGQASNLAAQEWQTAVTRE